MIEHFMVPISRWREDANGLQWYAGFYLPVPVDEERRKAFLADASLEVKNSVARYLEQLEPARGIVRHEDGWARQA